VRSGSRIETESRESMNKFQEILASMVLGVVAVASLWAFWHSSDLVFEVLGVLFLGAIVGVLTGMVGIVAAAITRRDGWIVAFAALGFLYVAVPHVVFSVSLNDLKREFVRVGNQKAQSRVNSSGYWEKDYGGKLSKLVEERNRRARQARMASNGDWFIGDFGPRVHMTFFWMPWRAPEDIEDPKPY
jgi:hypothetical protein